MSSKAPGPASVDGSRRAVSQAMMEGRADGVAAVSKAAPVRATMVVPIDVLAT